MVPFFRALMEAFTIRDLRERTGELVRNAEQGGLAVVAKHGHPLFVAVTLDDGLLRHGVHVALAIKLFQDGTISLGGAAKLAGLDQESFIDRLSSHGDLLACRHRVQECGKSRLGFVQRHSIQRHQASVTFRM
jgi:prevent-host-death family protein